MTKRDSRSDKQIKKKWALDNYGSSSSKNMYGNLDKEVGHYRRYESIFQERYETSQTSKL